LRQPVVDLGATHRLQVALERAVLAARPSPGAREVEVGQTGAGHPPHGGAVLASREQLAVDGEGVGQRRLVEVAHIDPQDPGAGGAVGLLVAPDDDHGVADQQQLGVDDVREVDPRGLLDALAGDVGEDQVGGAAGALDPGQESAVGLGHVGLVDAGLLHVGAGLGLGRVGHPACVAGRRCLLRGEALQLDHAVPGEGPPGATLVQQPSRPAP
jgi:hypothetical protein